MNARSFAPESLAPKMGTGLLFSLLVLTGSQPLYAQAMPLACVDPTSPVDDEGNLGGGTGTEGHIGDMSLGQWLLVDWGSLNRTPFNDELWNWLFGDPTDGGDDDDGGGGGTSSGGGEPTVEPGPGGASYEGESMPGPGCETALELLHAHAATSVVLGPAHVDVTFRPVPKLTVTLFRVAKSLPLPTHVKKRLRLKGNWSLAVGAHPVVGNRLRLPLVPTP